MELEEPRTDGAVATMPGVAGGTTNHSLTRLDWGMAFNRSSMHLSDQLRGKRFPADQLVLFDDCLNELPVELQEQAKAAGIDLIGFDFSTVPQQRAFEAALTLINASGRQRKIRIRPVDWIEACQLHAYQHRKGYRFYSQKEREELFKALLVLGMKPHLMYYHKMESGRQMRETRIAPLWRLTVTHLTNVPAPKRIEDVTPDYISKAEWFELEFEEIWFDQLDNFYIYKPRNLFERIRLSLSTPFEKIPPSLHPFLEWVFAEAGRIRNSQKRSRPLGSSYTLRSNWHEVALQSRLHVQLQNRNFKRAQEMIQRNAELAQKAGILDTHRFEGSEFVAVFNPRQFDELETYLKGRRRPSVSSPKRASLPEIEPPPFNPKRMAYQQLKDVVGDWKKERDRVKEKTRYKPETPSDQHQIRKLNQWIKSFEAVLYGRAE